MISAVSGQPQIVRFFNRRSEILAYASTFGYSFSIQVAVAHQVVISKEDIKKTLAITCLPQMGGRGISDPLSPLLEPTVNPDCYLTLASLSIKTSLN